MFARGEKKLIEGFIQTIKIKTETISVEEVKADYSNTTNEFDGKGFIVKVGDLAQEMFQGYATSLKYFRIGWNKQDKMIEKQDEMIKNRIKCRENRT